MSDMAAYDYLFKLVFLGNSGVGKSSLLRTFMDPATGFYADSYTMGVEFKVKTMEVEQAKVKLQIWDTAGQERYNVPLSPMYIRGAAGIIIVYDVDDKKSFEDVKSWMDQLNRLTNRDLASAKENSNVDTIFQNLTKDMVKRKRTPAAMKALSQPKHSTSPGHFMASPSHPQTAQIPAPSTFKHEPFKFEMPKTPESSEMLRRANPGFEEDDEEEENGKEGRSCVLL